LYFNCSPEQPDNDVLNHLLLPNGTSFASVFHLKAKPYSYFAKNMSRHKNISILQVSIAARPPATFQEALKFTHHNEAARYAQLCGAAIRLCRARGVDVALTKSSIKSSKYTYIRVNIWPAELAALRHMYRQHA
jgi:hypothetical protein